VENSELQGKRHSNSEPNLTSDLRYWVGFNLAKGIGPHWFSVLLERFGSVERAWHAPTDKLRATGLPDRAMASLIEVRHQRNLDAELRAIERAGAWVLTLYDERYPPLLKAIPDAPPLIYIKGTLTEADQQALAVVGTRRATTYGKTMTHELIEVVAQVGVTIVSGLAYGIDVASHEAALKAGGRTIAVMPNGIDKVYPVDHRKIADQIAENGALITELPLGEPAERIHFAPRNRIISGLSRGVLVVEAPERSGALMTASFAAAQGREVMAVPGNALSPASTGTNALIEDGATVVTRPDQILRQLGITATRATTTKRESNRPATQHTRILSDDTAVSAGEAKLLRLMSSTPQHIDSLAAESGLPVHIVVGMLTLLELKGMVEQTGIMQYVRLHG
jgi:DNA processing protein